LAARRVIHARLGTTPLERSVELSRRFQRNVYLKLENCSPIRSFKARGALASVATLSDDHRRAGIVTASTGNHGQGVAYAGRIDGVPVTVVVPNNAEPPKLRAIDDLGATLVQAGANLSEAEAEAKRLAAETGATYVEDGDHPPLMAGAATVVWEMLEAEPTLDTVLVPVGGGNLIAGTLMATSMLRPDLEVLGVQSQAAPGALLSWMAREIVAAPCGTFAAGLATERPGRAALEVMIRRLRQMALVTDDDLWDAMALGYLATGLPIEGAAASGIAALTRYGDEIPGDKVGIVVTGGRVSAEDLGFCFSRASAPQSQQPAGSRTGDLTVLHDGDTVDEDMADAERMSGGTLGG
jgi:threonine dehydratase